MMTDRLSKCFDEWFKNPTAPRTEEKETEWNDAVMEFFGFPDSIRKEEIEKIHVKYAAKNPANA